MNEEYDSIMDKRLIHADLNLLKVLHALLEERNVTHAANRLFVSQPAISKSLRRLRQLFGDALFVRSPRGLIATPGAEALAVPVKRAIEELGGLLKSTSFDAVSAAGLFRIAAPEPFAIGTMPSLIIRLQELAPNLILEVQHLMDDHLAMLMAGKIDFVIYLSQSYPEGFITRPILNAAPRIWFRKNHPLSQKKNISLADTCSYPQIEFHSPNVRSDDIRVVESAMTKQGLKRKVVARTSHILIALDVLMQSDALMLGPDFLSHITAFSKEIDSRSLAGISAFKHMQINLSLVQHERTKNSPVHAWLASEIEAAFAIASTGRRNSSSVAAKSNQVRRKAPAKPASVKRS